ncbi:hypothetical protein C41B8_00620 [Salinisphaera hydrothermalis C41B8]|uniref:Uncharacterized protein n=2 Tax=Salinisphaera TaxID=180541 RepID=A0A084IR73_SALHC|nr:hypothetical protein C41B8_00620 [Salinisphaera hydrothermalis C41B8]
MTMLKLLETLKDSAESAFDSAVVRLENCHHLVGGYLSTRRRSRSQLPVVVGRRDEYGAGSIYDLLRGLNREIGEFGTDVFQIIDDARARRQAEKTR